MLGAIYTGLSGMTAYTQGLDVISNNVANLNTPGFKVADPMFREIVYRQQSTSGGDGASSGPRGAGVEVDANSVSFRQGDLRDTGNPLDAAIDGNGFFVLNQDGAYRFTRAGQFEFSDKGILVDRDSGAQVLVSTDTTAQGFFDLNTARVFPPRATTEVTLTGTLARAGTTPTYELPNIDVFDASGTQVVLKAEFRHDAADPLHWDVDVVDADNKIVGTGAVKFNEDGTPATDASQIEVTVDPDDSDAFTFTLNLGEPGTFTGVSSGNGSTASQLQVLKQDGLQLGSLTTTAFDDEGHLKLTYSNGETKTAATLVLAQIDSPEQLQSLGRSLFASTDGSQPVFGTGLSSGLGRVVGGQVELSNVELTEQFTDLIIVQRGYQASSQISSVANEMIQQLLAMGSNR
jgi:flagellar hook protein FlgE